MKKMLIFFIVCLFKFTFSDEGKYITEKEVKILGGEYHSIVCKSVADAIALYEDKFKDFNKKYTLEYENYIFDFYDKDSIDVKELVFLNYFSDKDSGKKYSLFLGNNIFAYSKAINEKDITNYSKIFIESKEKKEKAQEMLYKPFCLDENKFISQKCSHENIGRIFLYNEYAFQNQFKENEQRALNYLSSKKDKFLISGKISKLSSGVFKSSYIIEFENGINVYIKEESLKTGGIEDLVDKISDEQKEKYLKLNKGDYVHVLAEEFIATFSERAFMKGKILDTLEYTYMFNQIKNNKEKP